MGQGLLKESGATGYAQGVSAAMAAWIMACRICFQVIFFELFIDICFKGFVFFSSFRTKTRESSGHKND